MATHEELLERIYQFFRDFERPLKEADIDVDSFYKWTNHFDGDYNRTRRASTFIFRSLMAEAKQVQLILQIFPKAKDGSDPWVALKRYNKGLREVVALNQCVKSLKQVWYNRPCKIKKGGNQ